MTTSRLLRTAPKTSVTWILGDLALPCHVDADKVALRWVHGVRTYGELRSRARRIAGAMVEAGAIPGDRVAAYVYNRGEIFELYFACAYAGLILAPLNFRFTGGELASVMDDCRPRVVVTETALAATMTDGLSRSSHVPEVVLTLGDESAGDTYERWASHDHVDSGRHSDIQMLLYTSGTTGRPKGVVMTQESVMALALQQAAFYPHLDEHSTTLIVGPLYNTAAVNEQSIVTLLVGGTVGIMPSRNWTPEAMADLLTSWRVTHTLIYPSMMARMLEADARSPLDFPDLEFVLTGGENCPPALMQRFAQRWAGTRLAIAYGSTETGVITMVEGQAMRDHPASVGRSMGAQTFVIADEHGHECPVGSVGRVLTAGPGTAAGYWEAPELEAAVFFDGWVDTGDLGHVDADGFLYLEGRSKDLIISKGQNIYPAEIENALAENEAIADVAVIGVPDSEFGEAVTACVVLAEGRVLTESDVVEFVRQRIASYKKPRRVVFVEELPRNPSGKVQKKLLVDVVSALPARAEASE